MISRAASRTNSDRSSVASARPSISAFNFSRVRSDAGILSIRVLLRQRPVAKPNLVDSPIRRRCTPTLFPASLGLHQEGLIGRLELEDAAARRKANWAKGHEKQQLVQGGRQALELVGPR